jgi:putative transposase
MARLRRLCVPGQVHWLTQRGHNGKTVFLDGNDRALYRGALLEAARQVGVQVHAYSFWNSEAHLLATPGQADALGALMQALGRRFVAAHHRRHGGTGTLWEGRYHCALVEPGATVLDVLTLVEGLSTETGVSSYDHRGNGTADPLITELPEYWQLGNTPFDRQSLWRQRVDEGLSAARTQALRTAARGGWAIGSEVFAARMSETAARPTAPRPRGRPRKKAV